MLNPIRPVFVTRTTSAPLETIMTLPFDEIAVERISALPETMVFALIVLTLIVAPDIIRLPVIVSPAFNTLLFAALNALFAVSLAVFA